MTNVNKRILCAELAELCGACHDKNTSQQADTNSLATSCTHFRIFKCFTQTIFSTYNSFIQVYAGWKLSRCSSGKNLIMENNLLLVNNVKQAALNCPGPAGFIIPSKFNYFLRKQLWKICAFLCCQTPSHKCRCHV